MSHWYCIGRALRTLMWQLKWSLRYCKATISQNAGETNAALSDMGQFLSSDNKYKSSQFTSSSSSLSFVFHAMHRLDVFPQSTSSNSFSPMPTLVDGAFGATSFTAGCPSWRQPSSFSRAWDRCSGVLGCTHLGILLLIRSLVGSRDICSNDHRSYVIRDA